MIINIDSDIIFIYMPILNIIKITEGLNIIITINNNYIINIHFLF
jgi:hypothetical protein